MNMDFAPIHCVTDFGAVGDGQTLNTTAIQSAIEAIAKAGGGTLHFPSGVFISGALFLKPDINLHLAEGAVIQCAQDVREFPKRRTRIEGHFEESFTPALINAERCDNLKITGEGTLDGNGRPIWDRFWRGLSHDPDFRNLDLERVRLCFIENSRNVRIEGVTFKDSQYWNLHLYNCREITVEHARFLVPDTYWKPPSTDGIDIDSCQQVVIRGCTFSITDDCICLKGTKGPFALKDAGSPPVEHVRISDCEFRRGCGAVTCGSEATVVRDVIMENCRITGLMPLLRLKLRPDTPQRYENLQFRNISMEGSGGEVIQIRRWKQYFDLQGQPEPESTVRNISISNVTGSVYSLGEISGNQLSGISLIKLENLNLKATRAELLVGDQVQELQLNNVVVNGLVFNPPH